MIGIISKPSHCKTHLKALRDWGLDAVCLGGGKTVKVPRGTRIVVLRTASCSHRASDVAFSWARRDSSRLLLVQNGLSGLKKDLEIHGLLPPSTQPESSEEPMNADLRRPVNWNAPFPKDKNWTAAHSIRKLRQGFEDMSKTKTYKLRIEGGVSKGSLLLCEATAEAKGKFLNLYLQLGAAYASKSGVLYDNRPSTEKPVKKQFSAFRKALLNNPSLKDLQYGFLSNTFGSGSSSVFYGNPRLFTAFLFSLLPEGHVPHKRAVLDYYTLMTGRGMDSRLPNAYAWLYGFAEPSSYSGKVNASDTAVLDAGISAEYAAKATTPLLERCRADDPRHNSAELEQAVKVLHTTKSDFTEDPSDPTSPRASVDSVESNTNAILELMEENQALMQRVNDLEKAQAETLRVAQAGALQALSEMRDDLRVDISNAFDALAADQAPVTAPFEAINQLKATLKAAGFTGTLTLTID